MPKLFADLFLNASIISLLICVCVCVQNYRMDKHKSFVFARQYGHYFSRRINALVPRNQLIKTTIGMVTHDFHSLKTMTMNDLSFSQNCLNGLINLAGERSPEISSHKIR